MARIAGVDLPNEKQVKIALTRIYGIGHHRANKVVEEANVDGDKRASELTDKEVTRLTNVIEKSYKVEGELRQEKFRNIKRLKDIKCYRGIRHKVGLPVRGQKTRTNAVTRKGKNIAVGGLKQKLEKK
jgi:small subunit ribosomal protein S13